MEKAVPIFTTGDKSGCPSRGSGANLPSNHLGRDRHVAGDRRRRFYRDAGRSDVVVCDLLGHDGKWRNLAKRQLADIVPPAQLMDWLKGRKCEAVIHLGAISETTATDGDLVLAEVNPERYVELGQMHLFNTTARPLPALAGGMLFARDEETLKCVDLR